MPPALGEMMKTVGAASETSAALRTEPGETIESWPPLANFVFTADVTRVTVVSAELGVADSTVTGCRVVCSFRLTFRVEAQAT